MNYPFELRRQEIAAIRNRRRKAFPDKNENVEEAAGPNSPTAQLEIFPPDTTGLALSGGGIRSATVGLGVLQALAKKNRLRSIDFLSTVSGGGYTGSFIGRLFTRALIRDHHDPCGRAQEILANGSSPQLEWLRAYGNYIFNQGSDIVEGAGMFWRNLFTIYLVFAFLGVALFGVLHLGGEAVRRLLGAIHFNQTTNAGLDAILSPWWPLPIAILAIFLIPCSLAYWLAPTRHSSRRFSFCPLAAWMALLAGLSLSLTLADALLPAGTAIAILILTMIWMEICSWNLPQSPDRLARETPVAAGLVIRNRLTRALGEGVMIFLWAIVWVLLDSLSCGLAQGRLTKLIAAWGAVLAPFIPFLRTFAVSLGRKTQTKDSAPVSSGPSTATLIKAGLIAFSLAAFLVVVLNAAMHRLFAFNGPLALTILCLGLAISIILGRAFNFLNFSSLQQAYAARLCRTFLGASNPDRFRAADQTSACDVTITHPNDDLDFALYHPEANGGPLHLIGVCVNETVDVASDRNVPNRKGVSMCIGPCGVTVGCRFHSLWSPPPARPSLKIRLHQLLENGDIQKDRHTALQPILRAGQLFHVLQGKTDAPVVVESLTLSGWIGISGAAFGTGTGRTTSLPLALLLGLANLRLGYWWDSGLSWSERPGTYPANLWRRLKHWSEFFFPMQSLLLSEFRAKFLGPSQRRWNLSDGGHFDLTGIYELLRRRVPFIIAVDAGEDPAFAFVDDGELVRQARIDFGISIEFLENPATELACFPAPGPPGMLAWLNPQSLGKLSDIREKGTHHAALARAKHEDGQITWILLLKSSLTGDETLDLVSYQKTNPAFPNDPTTEQFFGENQWESYRMLGEHIADSVFK